MAWSFPPVNDAIVFVYGIWCVSVNVVVKMQRFEHAEICQIDKEIENSILTNAKSAYIKKEATSCCL